MRALLLAAGLGTRLRPLTYTVPKCLVEIRGKPLIDYWLELLLTGALVERVLINTHWLPEQMQAHIEQSRWRDQVDLVHEVELLGTGGSVLANQSWLGTNGFLVAHADNLTVFDLRAFASAHAARPTGTVLTMMTFLTDDPHSCGIVECDLRGIVTAFHEKCVDPPGNQANAAVYIFEPEVFDVLRRLGKPIIDISTEVISKFLGRIGTFANTRYHRDIGTPDSLLCAEREFAEIWA